MRKPQPKPHNSNGDPLMQWVAVTISITIQHLGGTTYEQKKEQDHR